MVQKLGRTKRVLKIGEIGAKYDIVTVKEKKIAHRGNNTRRRLKMASWNKEVEALYLKASNIRINK